VIEVRGGGGGGTAGKLHTRCHALYWLLFLVSVSRSTCCCCNH
jgi:hypothetical protein